VTTYSPDGHYWWDGHQWQLVSSMAHGAAKPAPTYSPDGHYWWDGKQWQLVSLASHGVPTPRAKRKLPHQEHPKVVIGVAAGVVLLIALSAIASATQSGGGGGTAATIAATTSEPKATATPTVTPTTTATPTVTPTAMATPKPVATPKPAAAAPAAVMQMAGNGTKASTPFDANKDWTIKYGYDCSGFGGSGNFQIYLYQGTSLVDIPVNELAASGQSSTQVYDHGSGLHLEINSECSWNVAAIV
jgi:hypothetical protein